MGAKEGKDEKGRDAVALLRDLSREFPDGAEVYALGEMDLAAETERGRLVAFLRSRVPGIWNVADDQVLELVGGYPRVVSRWIADDASETARTLAGLQSLKQDANQFRYRDLEKLLLALDGDQRKLAVRVALVPLVEDAEAWSVLRPVVLANLDPDALDDLKLANVLDKTAEVPRFDHATRRDAGRSFLEMHRLETVRAEARLVILGLAGSITRIDMSAVHYASALRDLQTIARQRNLGSLPLALCQAAATLFGERLKSSAVLIDGVRQAQKSREPGVGFVLAAALFHTLIDAEVEGDRERRNALLDELRALARTYPDNTAVREQLANGLVNTSSDAQAEDDRERRDALLVELCVLAGSYPDDTAVRERLAMGLFNTLIDAKAEGDRERRDALLVEFRTLAGSYPDDTAVRKWLASGLNNTLVDAQAEGDRDRRDALLIELRNLAGSYPDDTAVRERLAGGLFNTLIYAQAEDDRDRRDALLVELRTLAGNYPDDTAVREQLAKGLVNTLIDATAEGDRDRRGALLVELRTLAGNYPDDTAVREQLAGGLFNTLNNAQAEDDRDRRDGLLVELHTLAGSYPDDTAVREQLAKGLINTLIDATAEGDRDRRGALLVELRTLAGNYPDDTAVREIILMAVTK